MLSFVGHLIDVFFCVWRAEAAAVSRFHFVSLKQNSLSLVDHDFFLVEKVRKNIGVPPATGSRFVCDEWVGDSGVSCVRGKREVGVQILTSTSASKHPSLRMPDTRIRNNKHSTQSNAKATQFGRPDYTSQEGISRNATIENFLL